MIMENVPTIKNILCESIEVKKSLSEDAGMLNNISEAAAVVKNCLSAGGKLIVFGNGGSAADSQHFAAELMVRFEKERKALACIALTTDTSVITATANDYDYSEVFSRQLEALMRPGDVVMALSTSGSSQNVMRAVRLALSAGVKVIGLTGGSGGDLAREVDIPIVVPSGITARIQETHSVILHAICSIVEG